MTNVITIMNSKGGTGKTTTASALGVCLSQRGKRVLLIDLDSQNDLTQIFFNDEQIKTFKRTIFHAMIEGKDIPRYKAEGVNWKLDLCPSSLDMIQIEKAITLLIRDNVKENNIIKTLLRPVSDDYDYIIIDCPPSMGLVSINAMTASNYVLIPTTAGSLASLGLDIILRSIDNIRQALNNNIRLLGVFLCKYDKRRKLDQYALKNASKNEYLSLFNTKIRDCIEIAESPVYRQNIIDYAGKSNGATDYTQLTNEFLERIGRYEKGKRKGGRTR